MGVLFLPHLTAGERGAFVGLTASSGRSALARAGYQRGSAPLRGAGCGLPHFVYVLPMRWLTEECASKRQAHSGLNGKHAAMLALRLPSLLEPLSRLTTPLLCA